MSASRRVLTHQARAMVMHQDSPDRLVKGMATGLATVPRRSLSTRGVSLGRAVAMQAVMKAAAVMEAAGAVVAMGVATEAVAMAQRKSRDPTQALPSTSELRYAPSPTSCSTRRPPQYCRSQCS